MHRYPPEEDYFKDSTMTFGEHLEELRMCLFRALLGLVVGFLVALPIGGKVVQGIQWPLKKALKKYRAQQAAETIDHERQRLLALGYSEEMIEQIRSEQLEPEFVRINPRELSLAGGDGDPPANASSHSAGNDGLVGIHIWKSVATDIEPDSLSVQEPFLIYVKGALLLGLILSSPWVFYQIWTFVAAGLYPHEKRFVHIFLPFSVGLFLVGAATAFFFVFDPVLQFLFMFNDWLDIDPRPRINEWLGFVLILPIGFGISFQLPLVMLFLERIGIFTIESYLSRWRIAVLVIFVLAMLLTPADPGSMLLMAIPLTLLYFGGVALCRYMPKLSNPYSEPDGREP